VIPPFSGFNIGAKAMIAAGAGYVLEYLDYKKINNSLLDMRLNDSEKNLFNKIIKYKPDLIGFQVLTFRNDIPFDLIKKIKSRFKNVKIVIGGPHTSMDRTIVLEEHKDVDFVVKIEGEETLYDLIKGVPLNDIMGLIYRKEKKIIDNPDRHFIRELDLIPSPRYRLFDLNKYDPVIPLITSRGCPYNCTFCPVKTSIGRVFRSRSPENLIKEVEFWYNKGFKRFQVLDDNFTLIADRVSKFCSLVKNKNFKDISFSLPNGIRADRVSKELLVQMKEAGFDYIAIAVESANDRVLKVIKKGETLEQIENAIRWSIKIGFDVELFFIIGSQTETEEEIRKSFAFAKKYPVSDAKFYNLIPFPNTELYSWIEKNARFCGNLKKRLQFYAHQSMTPFFETKELPFKTRRRLLQEGERIRKQIVRKNLARKFKKLGIFADILAFILFIKPIHKLIEYLYSKQFVRRFVQKMMKLFNVQVRHF
jgi:radical SAM superfamily enzyme YgiQ (UPF0313 family)